MNEINIRPNPTTTELNLASWPHLAGLKFPDVDQDDVPILIGIDVVVSKSVSFAVSFIA